MRITKSSTLQISAIFSLFLVDTVFSCAATPGGGNPTLPETCTSTCTLGQVEFRPPADATEGLPTGVLGTGTTGCNVMTVTCMSDSADLFPFIEFNDPLGGPSENSPPKQTVTVTLNCRDGEWFYSDKTPAVTAVRCDLVG